MPSFNRLGMCVLLAATAAGCASRAPSADVRDERPTRRQRDVISKEELADPAMRSQSVLDVVRLLRPHFLNNRGANSIPYTSAEATDAERARAVANDPEAGQVHASIDGGKVGSVNELRSIHASNVVEIRYLSAAQAMQKFGGAARQGPVILVLTIL